MQTKMLINGELVAGDGEALCILNPATGAEVGQVSEASAAQVEAAVRTSQEAFGTFSLPTPAERAAMLLQIAEVIEAYSQELTELAAMKGSGTGSDMSVYALAAYTAIRHVMVAH